MTIESELTALVRAALADLGAGPGVLADWLEERGDRRGVLLRRRWNRWRTERALAVSADADAQAEFRKRWEPVVIVVKDMGGQASATLDTAFVGMEDDLFRKYLRRQFPVRPGVRAHPQPAP